MINTAIKPSEIFLYKCNICKETSKYIYCFEYDGTNGKPPKAKIFYCKQCWFHTIHVRCFNVIPNKHLLYVCQQCPFQTKYLASVRRHRITHKTPKAICKKLLIQCDRCSFATNRTKMWKTYSNTQADT